MLNNSKSVSNSSIFRLFLKPGKLNKLSLLFLAALLLFSVNSYEILRADCGDSGCCVDATSDNSGCLDSACQDKIVRESDEIEQAFLDAFGYISKRDYAGLKEYLKKCENYRLKSGDSFIDALLKDFCSTNGQKNRWQDFDGLDPLLNGFQELEIVKVIIFLINNGADYKSVIKVFIKFLDAGRGWQGEVEFDFSVGFLIIFFVKNGLFDKKQIGEEFMEAFINYAKENKLERCLLAFLKIIFQKSLFSQKNNSEKEKIVKELIETILQNYINNNKSKSTELIILLNMILSNKFAQKYKKEVKIIANIALQDKNLYILQAISDSKIKMSRKLLKKIKLALKEGASDKNPIVLHTQVLKELKENFRKKNKKNNTKPVCVNKATQTESFLKVWFDQERDFAGATEDYDNFIDSILKEKYRRIIENEGGALFGKDLSDYANLLKLMLKKERQNADHYVFYHANNASTQIVFDVQTATAKWLKMEFSKFKDIYLRFEKTVKHDDINDFLKDYDNEYHKAFWPDCEEPMRSQVLSVNLCPFGNTGCDGECSLYYFVNGVSCGDPTQNLAKMFDEFGFCKDYIEKIKILYALYIEETAFDFSDKIFDCRPAPRQGNMLQIFIPKDKVDKFAYLSEAGGRPFEYKISGLDYDESKKRHVSLAQFLDKYINDPYSLVIDSKDINGEKQIDYLFDGGQAKKIINGMQARIVFMPNFYDKESGIKIYKYNFASTENKKKYKQELEKVIDQMMGKWIDEREYEKMAENDGNRSLLRLLRYVREGESYYEQELGKAAN